MNSEKTSDKIKIEERKISEEEFYRLLRNLEKIGIVKKDGNKTAFSPEYTDFRTNQVNIIRANFEMEKIDEAIEASALLPQAKEVIYEGVYLMAWLFEHNKEKEYTDYDVIGMSSVIVALKNAMIDALKKECA